MPAVSEKQRRAAFAALTVKRGKKMAPTKDYGKGKKRGGSSAAKAMAQMPTEKLTHFTKMKKGKKPRKA